ncbi:MAG: Gfo/Idh/MocA family protein, partial [Puniceicoccaceae bacterium]
MKTNDHRLKIAFIGAGGINSLAHYDAVQAHPELYEILGVCDPVIPAAEKLAERCGPQTKPFASMEALYEAIGDQVEGVVIGTPHFQHEPGGIFFLERGIPILMEKPVTCNLRELEALQALEKDGVFVQVAQMQRFDPEAMWLKDYVQSPETFGELVSFDLNVWQNIQGYV